MKTIKELNLDSKAKLLLVLFAAGEEGVTILQRRIVPIIFMLQKEGIIDFGYKFNFTKDVPYSLKLHGDIGHGVNEEEICATVMANKFIFKIREAGYSLLKVKNANDASDFRKLLDKIGARLRDFDAMTEPEFFSAVGAASKATAG
jgi:hypothetical protein